jgi:hypothetical protein
VDADALRRGGVVGGVVCEGAGARGRESEEPALGPGMQDTFLEPLALTLFMRAGLAGVGGRGSAVGVQGETAGSSRLGT